MRPPFSSRRFRPSCGLPALATLLVVATLAGCAGGAAEGPEPATTDRSEPARTEGPPGPQAGRANVVVVMTDDQTIEDLEQMPRARRLLGERGASFEDYFVSFPLCCPSRATYLTGQYAHNNGVISNNPDFGGGSPALRGSRALPVWLQDAGYVTASIGRYLNFYGVIDPERVPTGWDEWVAPPGSSTYLMFDYQLNENGRLVSYGNRAADYQTDVLARKAVRFIEERAPRRRPFFLSVTPLAPHDESDEEVPSRFEGPRPAPRHRRALSDLEPAAKPSRDPSRFATGSYRRRARSLLAVDELVGDLVGALRRSGELGETYVLFTSDNGFLLGEHGAKGKVAPYEETVHVPLLVRGPGIEAGSSVPGEAANVDLAPTIAAIAGAEPTVEVDGVSLLDALHGEELPRRDILLENLDRSRVPRQRLYAGIRNRAWSYVEYARGGRELFDMRSDPFQLENLAERPGSAPVVRRLQRRLARLRDCAGPGCR